jgi:hypothetical protein
LFGNDSLLRIRHIHDYSAFEHFGEAGLRRRLVLERLMLEGLVLERLVLGRVVLAPLSWDICEYLFSFQLLAISFRE